MASEDGAVMAPQDAKNISNFGARRTQSKVPYLSHPQLQAPSIRRREQALRETYPEWPCHFIPGFGDQLAEKSARFSGPFVGDGDRTGWQVPVALG